MVIRGYMVVSHLRAKIINIRQITKLLRPIWNGHSFYQNNHKLSSPQIITSIIFENLIQIWGNLFFILPNEKDCVRSYVYLLVTIIIKVTATIEIMMPVMMFAVSASPKTNVPTRIAVIGCKLRIGRCWFDNDLEIQRKWRFFDRFRWILQKFFIYTQRYKPLVHWK